MTEKLNLKKAPYDVIHQALIEEWDPIEINDIPEALNEYDSYIPKIYELLLNKKSQSEVFDYLWCLETQHMGLSGNRQRTEKFAERLLKLISVK